MPVTDRNQSRRRHERSRVSPNQNGQPIGKCCHRPSSAVGEPIGRSPLFRLLPGQPEESRNRRANQVARCRCHTALGRFQATARGGGRAPAAIGSPGGALRLAPGDEAARRRNPAPRHGPIAKPEAAGSAQSLRGTGAHLYDLTGRAGRGRGEGSTHAQWGEPGVRGGSVTARCPRARPSRLRGAAGAPQVLPVLRRRLRGLYGNEINRLSSAEQREWCEKSLAQIPPNKGVCA